MNKKLYSFMILLILFFSHNICPNTLENQQIENTKTTRNGWFNKNYQTKMVKKLKAKKTRTFIKISPFACIMGCLVGLFITIFYGFSVYTMPTILFMDFPRSHQWSYLNPTFFDFWLKNALETSAYYGFCAGLMACYGIAFFGISAKMLYCSLYKKTPVSLELTEEEVKRLNSLGF